MVSMEYSFEGISTHPNLRIKPEPTYIDKYDLPCHIISGEEGIARAYGMIRNRKPLPISSSEDGSWSISDIITTTEE